MNNRRCVSLIFSPCSVDHSAADWDTLGLNFATLFEHVPPSAHPGQTQDEVVTMLREQLTEALGADSAAGEGADLLLTVTGSC